MRIKVISINYSETEESYIAMVKCSTGIEFKRFDTYLQANKFRVNLDYGYDMMTEAV